MTAEVGIILCLSVLVWVIVFALCRCAKKGSEDQLTAYERYLMEKHLDDGKKRK